MAVALFAVLTAVIAVIPDRSAVVSAGSVYGSFLLSREAGGYVLLPFLSFYRTFRGLRTGKERLKKELQILNRE